MYGELVFLCVVLQKTVWKLYLYGQIGFPRVVFIIVLSLESLFVRSNRISVCSIIIVLSLEFLFVRSHRISMYRITMLSLESLFGRSNRIYVCRITVV